MRGAGIEKIRFEQYREAWNLMKPLADPAGGVPAATGEVAPT